MIWTNERRAREGRREQREKMKRGGANEEEKREGERKRKRI